MNAVRRLKKHLIVKKDDVKVMCHDCFDDVVTLDEVKEMSFKDIRPLYRWAAKRFDNAWMRVSFRMPHIDEGSFGILYLDFDGDGIVYDELGAIIDVTNNPKSSYDRLNVVKAKRWIRINHKEGDDVLVYVNVVNNAPRRPLSFPAFYKKAFVGEIRKDVYELYYESMARIKHDGERIKNILSGIKNYDAGLVNNALNEVRKIDIRSDGDKPYLGNNLVYGNLKPIEGYSREMLHEYIKVINTLKEYGNIRYMASSVYDVISIRDKRVREEIAEFVKNGRILLPLNLTDFDTSILSGEMIVRGLITGYGLLRKVYGVTSSFVNMKSFTLTSQLPALLQSAGVNRIYTDKGIDGIWYGMGDSSVEIRDRAKAVVPLTEYTSEMNIRQATDKTSGGNDSVHNEIVKEDTEGAYTTMAKLKVYNRQIEQAMHNVEFVATYAYLLGYEYPVAKIDSIYMKALKFASYNAIAGNNINRVNNSLRKEYNELGEEIKVLRDSIFKNLASDKHKYIVNASPFARQEWFKIGGDWFNTKAEPYSVTRIIKGLQPDGKCLKYTDKSIENDILKITFNKFGEIVSIIDKRDGSESIGGASMRIYMYNDPVRKNNAVNIADNYYKGIKATLKLRKHKVFVDGAMIIWQNQYRFRRNAVTMNIVLIEGQDYIRIDSKVKWEDTNTMLRTEVIPHDKTEEFYADTQFGKVLRKAGDRRGGHGEFAINKWILWGKEKGLGIASDCKYGVRTDADKISFALLRSTRHPDNSSDIGTHYFTFAIRPSSSVNDINRLAYSIVSPIFVEENIREIPSLVRSDNESIVIETVKKGNDDRSIEVRLYNMSDREESARIDCAFNYDKVYDINIVGDILGEADRIVSLKGYEIRTLLFKDCSLEGNKELN